VLVQLFYDELGPLYPSCSIVLVILTFLSYAALDWCDLMSIWAGRLSNSWLGLRTGQSWADTEGRGQAWMMLDGSSTEAACQRSSGIVCRLSPQLRMFRWLCHSHCPRVWMIRLKEIIRRTLGTLLLKIGRTGQRPEGDGRQFVASSWCLPTLP
jgi:hypothetical protein